MPEPEPAPDTLPAPTSGEAELADERLEADVASASDGLVSKLLADADELEGRNPDVAAQLRRVADATLRLAKSLPPGKLPTTADHAEPAPPPELRPHP